MNRTINGLHLYRSFENESPRQRPNTPRWLHYSIHHDHNLITSLPTARSLTSTSLPYFDELDNEEHYTQGTQYEAKEDEAYYYNDLDSNNNFSEEQVIESPPNYIELFYTNYTRITTKAPNTLIIPTEFTARNSHQTQIVPVNDVIPDGPIINGKTVSALYLSSFIST